MSFSEISAPISLERPAPNNNESLDSIPFHYPDHIAPIHPDDAEEIRSLLLRISTGDDSFFPYPEQDQFQSALQELCCSKHVVPVSSCGTAIDAVLSVLGLDSGDEVVTTGLTFAATAGSIILRGAKVVFADIDPQTLNITPETVRKCITSRTKVILPVHFAGEICDVDGFEELSKNTGIPVIYDGAHALGATTSDGRGIGQFGFATCLSFQFNKHITCLGEGGAILCSDDTFAHSLNEFKSFGFRYPRLDTFDGGTVHSLGTNLQMNKFQFATGLAQLMRFEGFFDNRRRQFEALSDALSDTEDLNIHFSNKSGHACLLFVVSVENGHSKITSSRFRENLKCLGVGTRHHYPPIWDWPIYQQMSYSGASCPNTAEIANNLISLPVHPSLTLDSVRHLSTLVKDALRR